MILHQKYYLIGYSLNEFIGIKIINYDNSFLNHLTKITKNWLLNLQNSRNRNSEKRISHTYDYTVWRWIKTVIFRMYVFSLFLFLNPIWHFSVNFYYLYFFTISGTFVWMRTRPKIYIIILNNILRSHVIFHSWLK